MRRPLIIVAFLLIPLLGGVGVGSLAVTAQTVPLYAWRIIPSPPTNSFGFETRHGDDGYLTNYLETANGVVLSNSPAFTIEGYFSITGFPFMAGGFLPVASQISDGDTDIGNTPWHVHITPIAAGSDPCYLRFESAGFANFLQSPTSVITNGIHHFAVQANVTNSLIGLWIDGVLNATEVYTPFPATGTNRVFRFGFASGSGGPGPGAVVWLYGLRIATTNLYPWGDFTAPNGCLSNVANTLVHYDLRNDGPGHTNVTDISGNGRDLYERGLPTKWFTPGICP